MKAVVWHGFGDRRVDDVPEPEIQQPTDAIVRLTASAIYGTDLHFVRGSMAGMKPGTNLGHEACSSSWSAPEPCGGRVTGAGSR